MDPEALLEQIRGLLQQYLEMGPDTPVAGEAQALLAAIDGGGEGGEMMGAPPEAMGGLGDEVATDEELPGEEPLKDFGAARVQALDDVRRTGSYGKSGQAKTEEEQPEDERRRRRKASA